MSPLITRAHGHALQLMALGLLASALVAVGATGASIWSWAPGLTQPEAIAMLERAGLNAPTLAAAGVTPTEAGVVATNAKAHLDANILQLRVAVSTHTALQDNVNDLERLVRAGKASADQLQDLNAARTTLASAGTSLRSRLDALSTAALADLSAEQRQRVATINANHSWGSVVGVEFLVENRTDQEWIDLRNALANQRICTKAGESVATECAQLIATAEADTDVSAARTGLDETQAVQNAITTNLAE